ncbi:MAG: tetratricopeptide repeat protein [Deltaproteobacteria bacterium]|nr:tetratricopeptide repeat protein [Deltaproteobacteria bacterium]
MFHRFLLVVFFIACSLIASSCFWVTTKEEGHVLRQDIQHVEDRITKMENELEQDRQHLTEMIERARTDVEKLEETLTRATRVLARNSADFGAEMETLKDKMRAVDGSLAEIRHDLEESAKKVAAADKKVNEFALAAGIDMPVDESKVPSKPDALIEMIKDSLAAGRYGEVRSLANHFLKRHPKHKGADDAQLYIARSYLRQKRWAKALGALRRFADKYPKSELTPEVLYEMASAFFALGDCTDARILIDAVTGRYKKSPFAEKARNLSEHIKKNKSRCTS